MRQFLKQGPEYFVAGSQVLFNPLVIKFKDKPFVNNPYVWFTYKQTLDFLNENDWYEVIWALALPRETIGQLTVIHNRYIRSYSLAPDWQLHRKFSKRDTLGKLIGTEGSTFDTATDKEHMILVAQQRFEEIMRGEEELLN